MTTTTFYAVQVLDEGFAKLIPHTGRSQHFFLQRKKAIEFRDKLKKENPNDNFRILKKTETFKPESWI